MNKLMFTLNDTVTEEDVSTLAATMRIADVDECEYNGFAAYDALKVSIGTSRHIATFRNRDTRELYAVVGLTDAFVTHKVIWMLSSWKLEKHIREVVFFFNKQGGHELLKALIGNGLTAVNAVSPRNTGALKLLSKVLRGFTTSTNPWREFHMISFKGETKDV